MRGKAFSTTGKTVFLHMAVVLAVIAVVYSGSVKNGFVYDDNSQILANPWIKDARFLPRMLFSSLWAYIEEGYKSNYYRPVQNLAYVLEYRLFGPAPMGWHVVNVALHALNAGLVYSIARGMSEKLLGNNGANVPLFAALVFALHPVNSETVSWVSATPELAYVLFFLLAFLCHMQPGRYYRYLSIIFFSLSVLSKETALALLPLFILYDAVLTGPRVVLRSYGRYLPYGAAALLYLVARTYALGGLSPEESMHPYLTPWQYFMNVFPLFGDYAMALVLPLKQRPFPIFDPVFSALEARAMLSFLLAASLAGAIFMFRRRIPLPYFFFMAVILLPLLPVFYIPALSRNTFADRYLYLPSVGFSLIAAFLVLRTAGAWAGRTRASYIAAGMLVLVAVLYSTAVLNRNAAWRDELSIWNASIQGSPSNYYAYYNLGNELYKRGRMDEAQAALAAALEYNIMRKYPDPMIGVYTRTRLGDAYRAKGSFDRAVPEYEKALSSVPGFGPALFGLAMTLMKKGDLDPALAVFGKLTASAAYSSHHKDSYINMGNIYARKGLFEEAKSLYEEALRIAPGDELAARNLGAVERRMSGGRAQEAQPP